MSNCRCAQSNNTRRSPCFVAAAEPTIAVASWREPASTRKERTVNRRRPDCQRRLNFDLYDLAARSGQYSAAGDTGPGPATPVCAEAHSSLSKPRCPTPVEQIVGASTIGYRGDMTSHAGALNRREQAAWRGFVSMQAGVRAVLASELQQRFGLSEPDYAVLVELSEAPEEGLRLRDLAVRLAWDKSRLSKQIGRMAARGLVERKGLATDARGAVAVLTETGRCAITRASPVQSAGVRKWFISALTPEQLDAMIEISTAVTNKLTHPHPELSQ